MKVSSHARSVQSPHAGEIPASGAVSLCTECTETLRDSQTSEFHESGVAAIKAEILPRVAVSGLSINNLQAQ